MKKKTKADLEKEILSLLGEIRKAIHIVYNIDDPKALEAWHILFNAHNGHLHSRTIGVESKRKVIVTPRKRQHKVELSAQSK
jgi:hypothetical protein